jgi:hypothetical protein
LNTNLTKQYKYVQSHRIIQTKLKDRRMEMHVASQGLVLQFDGGGARKGIVGIVAGIVGIEGIVVGMVGNVGSWVLGNGGNVDAGRVGSVGNGGNVGFGREG